MENKRRVLELFSGIGGMRMALEHAGIAFTIVSAIDVNPIANSVYSHNFDDKTIRNGNVLSLSGEKITKLNVDTILMSPPCQPFTRNGKFNDINDRRTDPFRHICDLLDKIPLVSFILMENVKGFEKSQACEMFKARLEGAGFHYQEYILSPHQFGVPNTRHRYYCIAKRKESKFKWKSEEIIAHQPDNLSVHKTNVGTIVERDAAEALEPYALKSAALLKHLPLMDVCTPDSINSMCFTKAYTHYAEGTGSVFCPLAKEQFDEIYSRAMSVEDDEQKLALLQELHVRYFTPKEVARLMSFPAHFTFPDNVTNKQRYRLLGNSINVFVVGVLLRELQ